MAKKPIAIRWDLIGPETYHFSGWADANRFLEQYFGHPVKLNMEFGVLKVRSYYDDGRTVLEGSPQFVPHVWATAGADWQIVGKIDVRYEWHLIYFKGRHKRFCASCGRPIRWAHEYGHVLCRRIRGRLRPVGRRELRDRWVYYCVDCLGGTQVKEAS